MMAVLIVAMVLMSVAVVIHSQSKLNTNGGHKRGKSQRETLEQERNQPGPVSSKLFHIIAPNFVP